MFISITTRPGGPETTIGWVTVDRHSPVATYTLCTAAQDGSLIEADLEYSRWSEPAVALVARCYALLPAPSLLVGLESTGFLGVALSFGRAPGVRQPIERAYCWEYQSRVVVDWHDGAEPAETVTSASVGATDVSCVLLQTLTLEAWHTDAIPPVPPPLSDIPVVTHNGRRGVRLAGVPRHARRHLERRAAYAVFDGHVAELAWRQFIGND